MPKDNLEPRDFTVGPRGVSGHYSVMMTNLRTKLPEAILVVGVWLFAATVPPTIDYRISPHITVALILKLALLYWTVKVGWPLVKAVWYGLRWLALEIRGVQWVTRNDHELRVTFYRVRDGSLQFDGTPRTARLQEELNASQNRKSALLREGWKTVLCAVGYFLIPFAFSLAYEIARQPEAQAFLARWNAIGVAEWFWFYLLIIPPLVGFVLTLFESAVYLTGAQYIYGAKLTDPPKPEKTLETIRDEQAHGNAEFVPPDAAAEQLSR